MRFTLLLVARSGRWLAPAFVYVVWLVLVLANPGPALSNGAGMFFGIVVFGAWFTIVTGNVDDDPHRDLCAAAAGSAARLHVARSTAAIAIGAALAAVTSFATSASGDLGHRSLLVTELGTAAVLVAGAFLGGAIGVFLHRPLVGGVAWSLVIALAATVGVALLPPVQHLLRDLDHGSLRGVPILLGIAAALVVLAVFTSSMLAARRS